MSVSHGLKKNKPVLTPEEQEIGELLLQCQQVLPIRKRFCHARMAGTPFRVVASPRF